MSGDCSWVIFGPDLEPLESEARRMAEAPGPRADGLLVAGDIDEVGSALAQAAHGGGGWCRLEHIRPDGAREPVVVQASHVRFVLPASSAAHQTESWFTRTPVANDVPGRSHLKGLR
jgi:hypothetical protein